MQNDNVSKEEIKEIIERFLADFIKGLQYGSVSPKINNREEVIRMATIGDEGIYNPKINNREEVIAEWQQLEKELKGEFQEFEKNEIEQDKDVKDEKHLLRQRYEKANIPTSILDDFFRLSAIDKKLAIAQIELEVIAGLKTNIKYLHNLGFKINDGDNEVWALRDYINAMERKHKLSIEILTGWKEKAFSTLAEGTLKHGGLFQVLQGLISGLSEESGRSAQYARETSKKLFNTLLVANKYDCQRKIEDLRNKIKYNIVWMEEVSTRFRESAQDTPHFHNFILLEKKIYPEEIASLENELEKQEIRQKGLPFDEEYSLKSSGPNLKKQEALSSRNSKDLKRKFTPVGNGEKGKISTSLEKRPQNINEFIDYLIKNIQKGKDKKYDSDIFLTQMVDKDTELEKSSVNGPEKSPTKKGFASFGTAQNRIFKEELDEAMKEFRKKYTGTSDGFAGLLGKWENLNTSNQKQRKEQDRQGPNNVQTRRKGRKM